MILENINKFNAHYISRRAREDYFETNTLARDIIKYWAASDEILNLAKDVSKIRGKYRLPTFDSTIESQDTTLLIDSNQSNLLQLRTQDFSTFICIEQKIDPSSIAALEVLYCCLKSAKDILDEKSSSHISDSLLKSALQDISFALASKIFTKHIRKNFHQLPPNEIFKLAKSSRSKYALAASRLLISLKNLQNLSTSALENTFFNKEIIFSSDLAKTSLFLAFAIAESTSIVTGLPILKINIRPNQNYVVDIGQFLVSIKRSGERHQVIQLSTLEGDVISNLISIDSETDYEIALASSVLVSACRESAKKSLRLYEAPLDNCFIVVNKRNVAKADEKDTVNILDIDEVLCGGLIFKLRSIIHSK